MTGLAEKHKAVQNATPLNVVETLCFVWYGSRLRLLSGGTKRRPMFLKVSSTNSLNDLIFMSWVNEAVTKVCHTVQVLEPKLFTYVSRIAFDMLWQHNRPILCFFAPMLAKDPFLTFTYHKPPNKSNFDKNSRTIFGCKIRVMSAISTHSFFKEEKLVWASQKFTRARKQKCALQKWSIKIHCQSAKIVAA